MRILVVGAGYLGLGIAHYLIDSGHEVYLFGRKKPDLAWIDQLTFIQGDIRNHDDVLTLSALNVEAIVYSISLNHHESEKDIGDALVTNVEPVWNLLEATREQRSKFIYLSTMQVYGSRTDKILESDPLQPSNHYGLTHLLAESIGLRYENAKRKTFNLRLSNAYGPPESPDSDCWWLVVNDLCRSSYLDKKIDIVSDGSPMRNFIYNRDVYRAVEHLLINSEENNGATLNLAGTTTFSILELALIVIDVYQSRYDDQIQLQVQGETVDPLELSDLHQNLSRFEVDVSNLNQLGFFPAIDLRTGILKFYEYFESLEK